MGRWISLAQLGNQEGKAFREEHTEGTDEDPRAEGDEDAGNEVSGGQERNVAQRVLRTDEEGEA